MIEVAVADGHRKTPLSKKAVRGTVSAVLKKEKVSNAKISFVFVGDSTIRRINTRYLGHPWSTDVITFPIETPPSLEAEIYVNVPMARRQARQHRVTILNELTRLIVHGVLHAIGYDDKRTKEGKIMFDLQERYVRSAMRTAGRI